VGDSVATLLEHRRRAGIVGRDEELAALHSSLAEDGPIVTAVHGVAGIGKSTLVDAFLADARAAGMAVVALDGRTIEPTERGFITELSRAIGTDSLTLDATVRRLNELGERVVVAVDTYEALRLIDGWLRQTFVPALGANVRVILAGRLPPFAGWHVSPGWEGLFRALPVGPLPEFEAEELLVRLGVSHTDANRVNRLVRGHPLALRVAAATVRESPARFDEAAPARVMEALARDYRGELDAVTREAVDAASVVRRMTRSLLARMVPHAAPQDAFDRLRTLPFVDVLHDGLALHETMQQAVAAVLRATDPERYRRLRRAAWRQLRAEVAEASRAELWRYTADMLYLIENPILREGFFPSDPHHYVMDAARADDAAAIREIAERRLTPRAAESVRLWWQRVPNHFRVARDGSGAVAAFMIVFERADVPVAWLEDDPITAADLAHLRANPVPPARRILFGPAFMTREGEKPSGAQAACWLDIKRMYMELRPDLHRIYTGVYDVGTFGPIVAPLGFQPIGTVDLDGRTYYLSIIEFGYASVDGWLAGLVGAELGVETDPQLLDATNRQLVVGDRRTDLTKLEFEVLHCLLRNEGRAVRRTTLLKEAWGYEDPAGSNVIEAVIRSLRRKLDKHAGAIETVRGLGYRVNPHTLARTRDQGDVSPPD
jgi:DNA-binding winged helix-turn-helix (wHTH) protein